jgi:hypothetical protein
LISLSLDTSLSAPTKFAKGQDLTWVQGFLGDWSNDTVTKDYNVRSLPAFFLIGPDGKLIATNASVEGIREAVDSAMARH